MALEKWISNGDGNENARSGQGHSKMQSGATCAFWEE